MPGLLGLLGGTSAGLALAPALRVLTWPLLALTVLMLARGWYLEVAAFLGLRGKNRLISNLRNNEVLQESSRYSTLSRQRRK